MRIIVQMVLTVYEDGTTKMTERALAERDDATGRFRRKTVPVRDDTPVFPQFEQYMKVAK